MSETPTLNFNGRWNGDSLLDDETGKPESRPSHQPGPRQLAANLGWSTIDFTHLYLGIDDTGPNTVRTVCLDADATQAPLPIACLKFNQRAEFLAYVKSCVRDSGNLYVACSLTPNRISGPSIHYLEEFEDIPVTRLAGAQTVKHEGDWTGCYGVEKDYLDAYGLALTMAYRTATPTLLHELWLRTAEVGIKLQEVAETLRILARATRVPF